MIWWLLAFAVFVWWLGIRIGEALDGVEGSHVLEDKQATTRLNPWARDVAAGARRPPASKPKS